MGTDLHAFISKVGHVLQIIMDLHVLALLIINITKSPPTSFSSGEGYTLIRRLYRLIELLAGLITPLAKK
jgi:hypothetical protein